MRAYRLAAGLMVSLALPGTSIAQRQGPARGSLTGRVLNAAGKGVAGARVLLQTSDGHNPRTTKTDANGRFGFRSLRPGPYDVRAQAGGQSSDWEHNLLVRSGRESQVTLRLVTKQPPTPPTQTPAKEPLPYTARPGPR